MRHPLESDRPEALANAIAGGGVSPIPGLRLGAGFARGAYRSADAASGTGDLRATLFNVEGEYSIGFTRITGEWIVDRFDTTTEPAVSRGYTLMGVRTISPRVFVAARTSGVSTPALTPQGRVSRRATSFDATLGYRLTTDFTLRGGYQGFRGYTAESWEHAVAASVVWARRWR
jgi:hypothetical protein